jgi:hypothetical protein
MPRKKISRRLNHGSARPSQKPIESVFWYWTEKAQWKTTEVVKRQLKSHLEHADDNEDWNKESFAAARVVSIFKYKMPNERC